MAHVNLKVPFHEVFTRVDRNHPEDLDDESDRWTFSGSKIETGHLALTLALLELPIRILCKPDCEGYKAMAPQYTAGRADGDKVNPFSVLQNLITKDQKDQEV